MKRIITILILVLIFQTAFTQDIKICHSNLTFFSDVKNFELRNDLSNGHYMIYYDSLKTKLDFEGVINNHKRIDKWTWYYEAGTKKREVTYSNGLFNGQVISYYPNEQKSVSISYSMGSQSGAFTRWHSNGNIKLEGNYTNGNPSGIWKYYNENGSPIKEEQH